jgi:hypothetical protein
MRSKIRYGVLSWTFVGSSSHFFDQAKQRRVVRRWNLRRLPEPNNFSINLIGLDFASLKLKILPIFAIIRALCASRTCWRIRVFCASSTYDKPRDRCTSNKGRAALYH